MLELSKTALFCLVISRATEFFSVILKYMPTCGHSHTAMHGPTPWGDWQGWRQIFQLGKEKVGAGIYKTDKHTSTGKQAICQVSVLIILTVTKNQGAMRESSRENKLDVMQCDLTEYLMLATAMKPPLDVFFMERESSRQFSTLTGTQAALPLPQTSKSQLIKE